MHTVGAACHPLSRGPKRWGSPPMAEQEASTQGAMDAWGQACASIRLNLSPVDQWQVSEPCECGAAPRGSKPDAEVQ